MISNNADTYTVGRLGIYFPATSNGTLADGDLTGQCVSLTKWFLQEMTEVPAAGSARGNARYVGDKLVAQGHAVEVPSSQRRRGDLVVWKADGGSDGKGSTNGHIGVLLSGDRVFEQNVGLTGTPSKMVGKNRVYVSRIDPLVATWRKGSPTYYRINTYKEKTEPGGSNMAADKVTTDTWRILSHGILGSNGLSGRRSSLDGHRDGEGHVGRALTNAYVQELFLSAEGRQWRDSGDENSINGINTRLNSIPALAAERDKAVEDKNTAVAENEKLVAQNTELQEQVTKLEEQLANGSGDSSEYQEVLVAGDRLFIQVKK